MTIVFGRFNLFFTPLPVIKRCVINTLISRGTKMQPTKIFTQVRNPISGSSEWEMQNEDYDYQQEIARSAFADMLYDRERNLKYEQALKMAIEKMHTAGKPANVLDIGTGTGLLSIMAARNGADKVTACEAFKPMADCCMDILKLNGFRDKITLIAKKSTEITVGEEGDMKEKANILVTEVFDTELIGEGALSTFTHAHKHLLEKDCIVIPDSAVMYAQVVECPTLQKWNRLNDLYDEELNLVLKAPLSTKTCPGSPAIHDIQLSQLPRESFRELSAPLPVLHYDWSGRTPLDMNKTAKQVFKGLATGKAQVIFMWWELNMDTEGKVLLSCAPWWCHPDVDLEYERPQDTIPWRDHWIQGVYYLPQEVTLQPQQEYTLVSCQDEYSLWFYLEDEKTTFDNYKRYVCDCGVHMALSRTHVSYLNDGRRSKAFLSELRPRINSDSVVLDFNGASLLGLAAAKMGAKRVYIMETTKMHIDILNDYIRTNDLDNVEIISEPDSDILKKVDNVVCDPNFSNAILPWENLRFAHFMHKYRDEIRTDTKVLPEEFELWAMPVEFLDLQKISIPLGICEGVDMTVFDRLLEQSRVMADAALEAQPLWEYPAWSRGAPRRLAAGSLCRVPRTCAGDGSFALIDDCEGSQSVNGFAVWTVWRVGSQQISSGPRRPTLGSLIEWDPHSRQAVSILPRTYVIPNSTEWSFQLAADFEQGRFDIQVALLDDATSTL